MEQNFPFLQMLDVLTSIAIGWVVLMIAFLICFALKTYFEDKIEQRKQKKQIREKKQKELSALNQKIQEIILKRQSLYFVRKTQKIVDKNGNELPQLKEYDCRPAPFADCESLPDKIPVFFDQAHFSEEGQKITLLFKPPCSGWISDFEVTALTPDNKVILFHPILGSLCLHNTEKQATTIGQKMSVYQVTRFKDGVYSSFCHIPSKEPFSLM